MTLEEGHTNIGKQVMSCDPGPKLVAVHRFDERFAKGPYTLLRITKNGKALLGDTPRGYEHAKLSLLKIC